LPLTLQVKLLRFLQEKKIQRLGGIEYIPVDVRVIAASNKDLEQEISKGNFREDIYYRLNGITIELPPLRERENDIISIASYLLEKYGKEMGEITKKLTAESIKAMKIYRWPGNIRELENKIKRALVLSTDKYIKPKDLGISCDAKKDQREESTLKEAREKVEREILQNNLEKFQGNLTKVSKSLGVSRSTVYDLMGKYDLTYKGEE
jgi:two-component system, NtrC family, response regulator